jgi:hypothetical protein
VGEEKATKITARTRPTILPEEIEGVPVDVVEGEVYYT